MRLVLVAILWIGCSSATRVRFDNHTLYRFTPKDDQAIDTLRQLEQSVGYDFWTSVNGVGMPVDILVPPQKKREIMEVVEALAVDQEILMSNIQEEIDREAGSLRAGDTFGWNSYHTIEEIYNWLRSLSTKYPKIVTLVEAGRSHENRPVLGVKVSFGKATGQRQAVWIDSNIHAREWISGAVNTYILNALLTSTDRSIRNLAERHDWYIFPVLNPDGFHYTYTTNRMWRKTRTPYGLCVGADPNRNWDYKWNQGGSSSIPCTETYAGPRAFSEACTASTSRYLGGIAKELLVYVSFHSYSQMLLLPYGHTAQHLDNYNVTYPIAVEAANSLTKRYGTRYTVGNVAETIYVATGSSMDWLKGVHHVPFAYTYELRDTGKYGFLLPADQIIPTAEETLDSVLTIVREADKISEKVL
ncbi:unnamed protein product [Phaedon cochleariae]|uniref:Zinc carboxypeptidase A 1 n=1 Tax=Phaedon cochleariae TaxID=80249 RepID=A0A9P0DZ81_PHACE|nr:unnamed protein product [Phaedon cochleariae]